MNISQYAARPAAKFSLKGQVLRRAGLSFTAQNAPPKYIPRASFAYRKEALFGGHKMKMIVDGKYLESDENDKCDYWDIEDRLYEQYKEMKMGD